MFILKNALLSIARNKGRNILIGIIVLVVAAASTIALAISNTASDLIGSYENSYAKELTISFNRENMMKGVDFGDESSRAEAKERFSSLASYTAEDVERFADSEHVESHYYTYGLALNGKSIEKAESTDGSGPEGMPGMRGGGRPFGGSDSSHDFTLTGYSSLEAMTEFVEGSYEMTDIVDDAWDVAFDGNNVFVNEELASCNSLKAGDMIELEDDDGNAYEFRIIGIFKENDEGTFNPMSMFSSSANTLITNADALVSIAEGNENLQGSINPTFVIDDYANADAIEAEFHDKGLSEDFTVRTNEDQATAGLASVRNVKSFAATFLVVSLAIGAIVLFVINMINIRERKYEIGVLRTIGVGKARLTAKFVAELLIVGLVALLIGAGIGAVASKSVSNALLASEIESSQARSDEVGRNFGMPPGGFDSESGGMAGGRDGASEVPGRAGGRGGMSMGLPGRGSPSIQAYDSIDAVVDAGVLGKLLGIGLLLILVSSLAAMISIQRFSPLTILKERS